jgi:uncharacterized damage-inducible protein DinB
MPVQPYSNLIRCKQWADRGLRDLVADNMDRLEAGDAHIVIRIIDHFHIVDRIFQHHLLGKAHSFTGPRSDVLPDATTLAAGIREVDDWYVDYVDGLSAADFDEPVDFTYTNGTPMRMTRGEIISHVCMHGSYHRGNAGILFQKKGVSGPRDAITDYLEAMTVAA